MRKPTAKELEEETQMLTEMVRKISRRPLFWPPESRSR